MLYPRPTLIARLAPQANLPSLTLGPYETQFIEVIPGEQQPSVAPAVSPAPQVVWTPVNEARIETTVFAADHADWAEARLLR
jgi:hypothetical protein